MGLALVWVTVPLAGLPALARCLCRTMTVGPSPGAGAPAGAGVDGAVVVGADVDMVEGVVDVLVEDPLGPVVVPVSGVVGVTGGWAPSPVVVDPVDASAPRAPPASGPPRLAAVSPPPAISESIARHDRRRGPTREEPFIGVGGLSRGWSSCGRLSMADRWSAPLPHDRGARHRYSYRQTSKNP